MLPLPDAHQSTWRGSPARDYSKPQAASVCAFALTQHRCYSALGGGAKNVSFDCNSAGWHLRDWLQKHPLQIWGPDLTLIRTSDGYQHPSIVIIDYGSLVLLLFQVLTRKCTWTLLAQFCEACAEHGVPGAVCTDNEAMFPGQVWKRSSRFLVSNASASIWGAHGRTGLSRGGLAP